MHGSMADRVAGRKMAVSAEVDPRWAKVLARDRLADGAFWYSVATTGVYCRPSCPSRTANPANVRFHATIDDARAAGFRPCKRCKPDDAAPDRMNAEIAARACRMIEEADESPSLTVLAEAVGLSPSHFHRLFKAAIGLTPKAYAAAHRGKRLRAELAGAKWAGSVTEAIYNAGFNSSGRFYAQADGILGMTPGRYRAGGRNEDIRFAVGECSLGAILVAASGKGVCAILMGDDPEALLHDLEDRFPAARLIGADAGFEAWVAQVVGLVEAPGTGLALPLDVRGTVFQQRVWQALREIPAGRTASYAEVARNIGAPRAVRAVAGACAANPLAVVIPCHRVVRTDGGLSGYRWGIDRKRALIAREAVGTRP